MSALVNYRSINQEILNSLNTVENNIRQISENNLFVGQSIYNGLVSNLQHIYDFSNIYVYPIYNLSIALEHWLQLPDMAKNFIIYKIRGRQPKILYNSLESEAEWIELTEEDIELELSPEPIEKMDEGIIDLDSLITQDGLTIYCIARIPEGSSIDVSTVTNQNFQVQLNESNEVHYYKYDLQDEDFKEIIVNRETQLGKGFLDTYLDIDKQAADLNAIANIVQNRRGIVAESSNGHPVLLDAESHDLNIIFDTGSLWFIKQPIIVNL